MVVNTNKETLEDVEVLQASIKAGSVAQIVVAVIAVIGLVYLLRLVMVTTLFSILLAFVLEPFVSRMTRIGMPRAVAALLAVVLMAGLEALPISSTAGQSISRPSCQNIPGKYVPAWRS